MLIIEITNVLFESIVFWLGHETHIAGRLLYIAGCGDMVSGAFPRLW
ncbi:hypothetical protein YPC_1468 [Yersinia pestis biovar Medievalis str. Harbin 35]|nr:hypothetical protein YPC_1468 [Yersinia pestis biovar Medievalis str. Harbin 35]EEO76296.1 hypothetical protein YP516_2494 [Yersinia pestis Nepal516]EEO80470.1 hypothetical protein YPF_3292 [Yersinia pestis biovar Orientalis str. India 195]EEO84700.1 hypothetical protein YPH_0519 [Yersinia pestis biovar Orientalis str. PEXU2]EEO89614.1 hypothetical protein YPS_3218 [Yersinia pestis Pestoides A]